MKVLPHLLAPDGAIPNLPRWRLLVYPGAVAIEGPDPAAAFENLFARHRWSAAWRKACIRSITITATVKMRTEGLDRRVAGTTILMVSSDGGKNWICKPGTILAKNVSASCRN